MRQMCDFGDPTRRACIDALLADRAMPMRSPVEVRIASQLNGEDGVRLKFRRHSSMDGEDGTENRGSVAFARRTRSGVWR